MKFKTAPKTKKAIADLVKPNLPKGWSFGYVSDDKHWFFVNVPIDEHFTDDPKVKKAEERNIKKLEKLTGFENNGGCCLVGGKRYTLDFFLDIKGEVY